MSVADDKGQELVGAPVAVNGDVEANADVSEEVVECECGTGPCTAAGLCTGGPIFQKNSLGVCCCRVRWYRFFEVIPMGIILSGAISQYFMWALFTWESYLRSRFAGAMFTFLLIIYLPVLTGLIAVTVYRPEQVSCLRGYFALDRFRKFVLAQIVISMILYIIPFLALQGDANSLEQDIFDAFGKSNPIDPSDTPLSLSSWMFRASAEWGPYGTRWGDVPPQRLPYKTDLVQKGEDRCERKWEPTLYFDLYLPKEKKAGKLAPLIFHIHGGSWIGGLTSDLWWSVAYMTEKGYGVVSSQYGFDCQGYTARDMVDHLTASFDNARENAESWGMDKDRIYVTGDSAGGHLALMFAYTMESPVCGNWTTCGIRSVFDLYGVKDDQGIDLISDKLAGSTFQSEHDKAYPLYYIGKRPLPPTITLHGTWDVWVFYSLSKNFHDKLEEAGVPHLLITLPTYTHVPEAGYWGGPAQMHRYALERLVALVSDDTDKAKWP